MSKYIALYESLCPDDPIARDDPRRPAIMGEMREVIRAKTINDAAAVVPHWGWPECGYPSAQAFVTLAREKWGKK